MSAAGEAPGYIQPHTLSELWFHTGTACNLACPFCLEGSRPGDRRLGRVTFEDLQPFIDEAVTLGVRQFSFTGGEPFLIKDLVRILSYALERAPCLVLTDRKSTRLNSSHLVISYAVFCLKKKKKSHIRPHYMTRTDTPATRLLTSQAAILI